jgi:hypothetical protein
MQRYTVYLYLGTALHISGGTSTHHQERIHLYLITNITPGAWPIEKGELLKKHTKQFTQFIKSIGFEVINSDINSEIVNK